MKIALIALVLFTLCLDVHAQFNMQAVGSSATTTKSLFISNPSFQNNDYYVNPPGLRMIKVGKGLTIGGGALLIGGIVLASQAKSYSYQYNSYNGQGYEEGDAKGAFGVLMIAGGVGMIIPGIIVWSKGSKKYNKYLEEQKLSINLNGAGVRLSLTL